MLLVHGLWMGGWIMSWLVHELREAGFNAQAVSYDSTSAPPADHVARLAVHVSEAASAGNGKVHLVGHSMGGVVVLRYLLDSPAPPFTGRAVLLGTPARGSQAALAFERQPWGPALLGQSIELWRAPFPPLVDSGLEVGAIAGDEAFGLGPLFVALPPPSDGVVTVDETRIPGLRDHLVLHVSHTGMLMSGKVAHEVAAFLHTGAFER